MNWDDVRIFLAVARKGSLTASGNELGMSASTVSRHVDELEARLGLRLFLRSQTGYLPSDAGLAILPDAERAEGAMDDVQRKAPGLADGASGIVRIAMPENFAMGLVMPEIAMFRSRHPRVVLEIVAKVGVANLTRREADVGLRLVRPDRGNLIVSRVGRMASALYASRSYVSERPFEPAGRGEGHDAIGWDEAFQDLRAATWLAEALPAAAVVVRTTSLQSQVVACTSGAGLAVLPCFLADPMPDLVRLAEPADVFSQDIWLVVHRDIAGTARVRAALDFLRDVVRRSGVLLAGG